MKILHNLTRAAMMVSAILLAANISSCDSNDVAPEPPGIDGAMLEAEGGRGTTVSIPLTLSAEAGIQSLTVIEDGIGAILGIGQGMTETTYTHDFAIPADATLGTVYTLDFLITDVEGVSSTVSAMVTVGKLIDTPATYAFTRAGTSTVSYSGQVERLDQLEEIKEYLKTADAGGVISEQALLDMFANTGDNGGGRFSFSSTKQLKNKTFSPDLDALLFEDLFTDAAKASVDGNAGVLAANGIAGLITREVNGSTILVDGNGREFTQLIEKGLMGAVFYNQIFNTYLSDDRTGDAVENTALTDGKNYTLMEHHWDEAFGYWDPPLDFASPWPAERGAEDRFWSHYSNVVDNVASGLLGTNDLIMTAYKEGRAAIVNNDLATKNAQRNALFEHLELVAAATAVHYLNSAIGFLGQGQSGEAFHVLSEVWAFTNAIRYSPRRAISLTEIEEILGTDLGADGNFWNATALGLNTAKSKLVAAFPALAPVQDDL
ncbi:MAG: DUF4856 domain-containing protein [Rhodothermales bacterium]